MERCLDEEDDFDEAEEIIFGAIVATGEDGGEEEGEEEEEAEDEEAILAFMRPFCVDKFSIKTSMRKCWAIKINVIISVLL
jgi:hypothetical protein